MSSKNKIVVFAYSDVGHACLKFLVENKHPVAHVYTHADKSGEKIWFPSVKELAAAHKIPFTLDADLKSASEQKKLTDLKPDLVLSFYYRNMIPKYILDLPKLGAYNMHGSLLPKFRGRAPVNWAVLKGESQTGATLHVMVEKPDAGDMIDQEAVPIGPDDSAMAVQVRVTQAAVKVLSRQIVPLLEGKALCKPQNNSLSTYFSGRKPEDGRIDWSKPAGEIHNLIRAVTHPYPGAFTDIFGKKTYIWASRLPQRKAPQRSPGELISEKNQLFIVCGQDSLLEVVQIQSDGEPEMAVGEFLKSSNFTRGKRD